MKKNRKRMCLVLGAVSAFLLVVMMRTGEAAAYSVVESKALGYSVYRCYTGMYDGSVIMPRSLNLQDIVNINSIINPSASDFAAVPSGVDSLQANPPADDMSCLELFAGSSSNPSAQFRGLLRGVGIDIWTSEGDKSALLKKMGYQAEEATGDGICVSFNMMKREKDGTMPIYETPKICSEDGTREGINAEALDHGMANKNKPVSFYMPERGYLIANMFGSGPECENDCHQYEYSKSVSYVYKVFSSSEYVPGFGPNLAEIAYDATSMDFGSLMDLIREDIAKHFSSGDPYAYTLQGSNPMNTVPYATGMGETVYVLSDRAGTALTVMNDLLGTSYEKIEDLAFTPGEQYDLYNYYLRNIYGINEGNAICDGFGSGQPTEDDLAATGWKKMLFKSGSSFKSCYVYPQNGTEDKLVYGLSPNKAYFDGTKRRWGELVDAINNLFDTNQLSADAVGGTVDSGTPEDEDDRICYDQSAGGLGWLVCSILPTVTGVGKSMWDFAEENMEFPARGVFGANSGVERAWGVIRNIANMVFIVLFLLVIFSQLTGYGIDNYGIKRILPKMVVTAILINLSLPICRLVIDISNIVGVGINALLSNIAESVADASGVEGASQAWRIGSLFGAGSISAIVAALFTFLSGPLGLLSAAGSLGLAALGFMITTVFSILFLYLILVARQAGIILCVVLAPVAIACGMLPNTEKTYKRWIDIFKVMLVLYPICGAMIGAGQLAGAVLASVPSEGARLAAMIVQVAPYFFVPTLTKNSLSGLGNLGVKLANMGRNWGNKVSGAASGGIKSSEPVKSAREWANMVDARRKAGLNVAGKAVKLGAIGTFLRGGKRGIAKSRSQYLRDLDTETRADNLMGVGYEAALIGQKKRAEKDLTADYVTLINSRTRSGEDETSLYDMYNEYIEKGNSYGAVAVARIAGRRKDTAAGFLSAIENGKFIYTDKEGKKQEKGVSKTANTDMKILSSVMKEIATGDNSGMYRASAPLGFEFAAQFNRNYSEDASGNFNGTSESSYDAWVAGGKTDEHGNWTGNVDGAIDNYITGVRELQGLKGSSLRELAKLIENDTIGQKQSDTIRRLAINAVEKRNEVGSGWDPTKAEAIVALTGGAYSYDKDSGDIVKRQSGGGTGQVRREHDYTTPGGVYIP